MKKQVAVIGLGRFGISLATNLHRLGHEVLAIDMDEKIVQSVATRIPHVVKADSTNEEVLRELGVINFDVVVVAIGSGLENSVLTTILLKRMEVPYIIARANNEIHGIILERVGADRVVYPEQDTGYSLAHEATIIEVSEYMPVVFGYGISKLKVPAYADGVSLSELGFGRKQWELTVLLVRKEKEVLVIPRLEEVVHYNDILIIGGSSDHLEKFLEEMKKKWSNQV